MVIYDASTIDIYIPGFRCGSVLSIVKMVSTVVFQSQFKNLFPESLIVANHFSEMLMPWKNFLVIEI